MRFDLNISLQYQLFQPTDLLLQIEAAHLPDQQVQHANINVINPILFERVPGNDGIGERIWVRCDGVLTATIVRASMWIVRPKIFRSLRRSRHINCPPTHCAI